MTDERTSAGDEDGQVSEVSGMKDRPDEISPEDATAGYPTSESGEPDEGAAGPDASPPEHPDESSPQE